MKRTPYYSRAGITLYCGDSLEVAPELDAESVSAVVTDPPYGLGFMGKAWDHSVPGVPFWRAFMGAMKPGAHLLAFGGSRTYHRMGVAIEDAGYELRDTLMWLYGSGFPKSHDVSKAIDKARKEDVEPTRVVCRAIRAAMDARGLKARDLTHHFGDCHPRLINHWAARDTDSQPLLPTWAQWLKLKDVLGMGDDLDAEVWRLNGRKGTPGENWDKREVIGIDTKARSTSGKSALPTMGGKTVYESWDITAPATPEAEQWQGWGTALKPAHEPIILARKPLSGTVAANVLQHGTGALNIDASRIPGEPWKAVAPNKGGRSGGVMGAPAEQPGGEPHTAGRWPANVILDEAAAAALDAQSGDLKGGIAVKRNGVRGTDGTRAYGKGVGEFPAGTPDVGYGDTGGASRFFYCAKASRKERNAGLDGMPLKRKKVAVIQTPGVANDGEWEDGKQLSSAMANHHPTVKPLALMRYLVTLITPPGGIVLDPFAGSGSTLVACAELGIPAIGIELSEEYCEIIARRVDHALNERPAVVQPSLLEMVAD